MKYKLAVFDMDGTILDTLEDLADSLNHVLRLHGFPERSLDEVRSFVGNGIRKLVERGLPAGTDASVLNQCCEEHRAYYREHCADKTKPYDGMLPLLKQLRENGCRTAVVSNKADYAVQELCRRYFDGMFDAAAGERTNVRVKPAPDLVQEVLEKLDIQQEEAVYIGDSDVDIETAQNAGMDCISVDWGFRSREFLLSKGASRLASAPEELARLLMK